MLAKDSLAFSWQFTIAILDLTEVTVNTPGKRAAFGIECFHRFIRVCFAVYTIICHLHVRVWIVNSFNFKITEIVALLMM